MLTVKVRFDGRVFVPEQPVNLPVGHTLEIPIADVAAPDGSKPPLVELLGLLDQLPVNADWPPDGAAQHDHYLYGTPKYVIGASQLWKSPSCRYQSIIGDDQLASHAKKLQK